MDARVDYTCPSCTEPMTVRANVDQFPVPSPDVATDEILDGLALDWVCPHCEAPFDTMIMAEIEPDPIPWVGDVGGTELCVDVRPNSDTGPISYR